MTTQSQAIVKHYSPPLSWLIRLGQGIVALSHWCVRKIKGPDAAAVNKPLSRAERKQLRKALIREAQNPKV